MLDATGPISATSAAFCLAAVGGLYALHHLRVQPKRRAVATLLFWREVALPVRTRVLWGRRLGHPWTFALLALIAVMAAAALTADRWISTRVGRDIVVVDIGAATASPDATGGTVLRAEAALVSADLDRLPASPALITAGQIPMLLSPGGVPTAVFRRQVDSLRPQSGASDASLALQLAAGVQGDSTGRILWYTPRARLPYGLPPDLAARVFLRRVTPGVSAAIVGVNFVPDLVDRTRGRLRVSLAGAVGAPWTVEARFGPETFTQAVAPIVGRGEARFDGVLADGGDVGVRLLPNDAGITVRLPDRRPLTFRFLGQLPPALRAALLASGNPAVDGEIAVATRGTPLPAGVRAAIVVEPADVVAGAPLPIVDCSTRPVPLENARVRALPVEPMVGLPLLRAGTAVVASLDVKPGSRTLHVSRSLVSDGADLTRRAAFPVLLASWCDQLAARPPGSTVVPWQRAADDPLWTGTEADGQLKTVADLPAIAGGPPPSPLPAQAHGDRTPWTAIVLSIALALLILEGSLFATRKIV